MLPRKHMLALFEHIKDILWDRLPSSYRNSPFFNLDEEIISTLQVQENELQIANDGLEPEVSTEGVEKPILLEIPKKLYPKKSIASACREILNKIKSLTFAVYDGETLEKLEEQLLDIVESFGKSAPTASGLILEPVKTLTKNKYKDQIPLWKSKKSHLTGRVGMAAKKQRLSRAIDVQPKTEETLKISKEVAPLDEALFLTSMEGLKKMQQTTLILK